MDSQQRPNTPQDVLEVDGQKEQHTYGTHPQHPYSKSRGVYLEQAVLHRDDKLVEEAAAAASLAIVQIHLSTKHNSTTAVVVHHD